jgi:MFS family permease
VQQAIEHAFTEMVAHAPVGMGRVKLVSEDLKPLPANDSRGLSSSALQFGLLLPSFVFGILLFVFGHGAALVHRLLAIGLFVLATALVAALTVGPLIGALSGHFLAIFAIGALFAGAAALTTYGLEAVLGFAGTGLAAFTLVLIGNATAGGGSNQEFLPNVFRQVGQALPNGATVRFIRNTVYFNGNHTHIALLVVALWALGGLALVLVAEPLKRLRKAAKPAL